MIETEHYQKKYLIPRTLQARVCMCDEPGATNPNRRQMNYCNICDKPYRWYVRICTACREYFIKDFRRHKICIRHSKCIECYESTESCDCDPTTWREGGYPDYGPLGLNPKKYTREELKGTFSFDSPF